MEVIFILISMIILVVSMIILAKAQKLKNDVLNYDELSDDDKKAFTEFYWKD